MRMKMPNLIYGTKDISSQVILNWILLLCIFSVITVIGNYVGYEHPISDSLIGIGILSFIALLGVLLELKLPFNISSIIYIAIIGIIIAFPGMPTSHFVYYYVSQIELLSIATVFIAYIGIGMIRNGDEPRKHQLRIFIFTILVILSTYLGYAMVDMLF